MNKYYEETRKFLKRYLFSKDNIDEIEKKYRYEHTLRVATIGKEIAEKEGLNELIVVLGCLLHDVGKFDTDIGIEHGRVSAKVAREFLNTLDLSQEVIEEICYGIAIHVDGKADFEFNGTVECEIISDCDNIDRFDAYRVFDTLKWDKFDVLNNTEAIALLKNRVERLQKLLKEKFSTKTSTEYFQDRVNIQLEYYKKLLNQYESTYSYFSE
ncbi:MAG: HD domain-containing protein [Clostridium sp.]